MRQVHNENGKPVQITNDLELLKRYADFGKPIFDDAVSLLVNAFQKKKGIEYIFLKDAPNKTIERIMEKVKEYDIGNYDRILDYVRGTVVFKNLEDLFDFINFAKTFDFSGLNLKDLESHDLGIIEYSVNSFSLSKNSLNKANIDKYPFLKEHVKLRSSEYMDFKLYMKIPMKPSKAHESPYMIAEVLCILEDFYNYCSLTHYLYELIRTEITIKNFSQKDIENFQQFIAYLIYHIHRYNVIEPYIVKPKHEIKLIEKSIAKEHKKNNFFIELSDLSKQQKNGIVEMTNIIGNKVYNKAANDLASIAMLQFKELIDSPFYRRYLCKCL